MGRAPGAVYSQHATAGEASHPIGRQLDIESDVLRGKIDILQYIINSPSALPSERLTAVTPMQIFAAKYRSGVRGRHTTREGRPV